MFIKIFLIFFLLIINIGYILLYNINDKKSDTKVIHISQFDIDIIKNLFNNNEDLRMSKLKKKKYVPTHILNRRNIRRYACRFKFCRIIESK
uniref:30S ribosomal protein S15 n=1 Tax=Strongyloides stercoralis TaxID=6248 RepID=A0A0K0EG63_STRER